MLLQYVAIHVGMSLIVAISTRQARSHVHLNRWEPCAAFGECRVSAPALLTITYDCRP